MITLSPRKKRAALIAGGLVLIAAVGTAVVLVTGPRNDPRPLTDVEAQDLAIARLTNFETGTGRFRVELTSAGQKMAISGLVDWTRHIGSAVVHTAGSTDDSANLLVQWNLNGVALHPGTVGATDDPPAPPADGRWKVRSLAHTGSDLDSTLLLLLNLGADRPDNPQLLAQSGAEFLRTDRIDGADVTIVTGPASDDGTSRLTYWLDGERMRRVEARLGRATEPATIDLTAAGGATIAPLPGVVTS